jgi:serine/threonine protein phosphatase 1
VTATDRPSDRIIAVGDIHGCRDALDSLLELIQLRATDRLVILGDVIDRGPDSRGAIERLLELRSECRLTCLLGNHEQMLLDAIDGKAPIQQWLVHGGAEMLDSYGPGAGIGSVDSRHVEFIRTWQDVFETAHHFFVHASYLASKLLASQPWQDLRWQSLSWHLPGPHRSGKTAVVGHTANKLGHITNYGHVICIDTYCHGGGWLTALEVETSSVWQANRAGEFRIGELPPGPPRR